MTLTMMKAGRNTVLMYWSATSQLEVAKHFLTNLLQEQFPLIQRQWETVSHFRTQIIHRATLSLRLCDKTCEVRLFLPIFFRL